MYNLLLRDYTLATLTYVDIKLYFNFKYVCKCHMDTYAYVQSFIPGQ